MCFVRRRLLPGSSPLSDRSHTGGVLSYTGTQVSPSQTPHHSSNNLMFSFTYNNSTLPNIPVLYSYIQFPQFRDSFVGEIWEISRSHQLFPCNSAHIWVDRSRIVRQCILWRECWHQNLPLLPDPCKNRSYRWNVRCDTERLESRSWTSACTPTSLHHYCAAQVWLSLGSIKYIKVFPQCSIYFFLRTQPQDPSEQIQREKASPKPVSNRTSVISEARSWDFQILEYRCF